MIVIHAFHRLFEHCNNSRPLETSRHDSLREWGILWFILRSGLKIDSESVISPCMSFQSQVALMEKTQSPLDSNCQGNLDRSRYCGITVFHSGLSQIFQDEWSWVVEYMTAMHHGRILKTGKIRGFFYFSLKKQGGFPCLWQKMTLSMRSRKHRESMYFAYGNQRDGHVEKLGTCLCFGHKAELKEFSSV